MTPQEALHEMSTMVYRNTDNFEMRISKECYKGLVNALEKQIPKKPTPHIVSVEKIKTGNCYWGKGTTIFRCPNCTNFINRTQDYCYKCGQALSWGGVDK